MKPFFSSQNFEHEIEERVKEEIMFKRKTSFNDVIYNAIDSFVCQVLLTYVKAEDEKNKTQDLLNSFRI